MTEIKVLYLIALNIAIVGLGLHHFDSRRIGAIATSLNQALAIYPDSGNIT
jgi:hypothetical protein